MNPGLCDSSHDPSLPEWNIPLQFSKLLKRFASTTSLPQEHMSLTILLFMIKLYKIESADPQIIIYLDNIRNRRIIHSLLFPPFLFNYNYVSLISGHFFKWYSFLRWSFKSPLYYKAKVLVAIETLTINFLTLFC